MRSTDLLAGNTVRDRGHGLDSGPPQGQTGQVRSDGIELRDDMRSSWPLPLMKGDVDSISECRLGFTTEHVFIQASWANARLISILNGNELFIQYIHSGQSIEILCSLYQRA